LKTCSAAGPSTEASTPTDVAQAMPPSAFQKRKTGQRTRMTARCRPGFGRRTLLASRRLWITLAVAAAAMATLGAVALHVLWVLLF
jgi:hypothetical protein